MLCGVRGDGETVTSATKQTRSCTEDEGWLEQRRNFWTQDVSSCGSGLEAVQASKLPEMQVLCSALDACVLGVCDETTRMLVRKEWTFMTHSECLQKILSMRCSHHTKHAWSKETDSDIIWYNTFCNKQH